MDAGAGTIAFCVDLCLLLGLFGKFAWNRSTLSSFMSMILIALVPPLYRRIMDPWF